MALNSCTAFLVFAGALGPIDRLAAYAADSTFQDRGSGPRGCADAQPGDFEENEPIDCPDEEDPAFNGGCSDDPPSFSPLNCGQPVHGESGTYLIYGLRYRDVDWWLVTVDTYAILEWTVTAEFPVLTGLISLPCPPHFIAVETGPACTGVSAISPCLPPGQYAAFLSPSTSS